MFAKTAPFSVATRSTNFPMNTDKEKMNMENMVDVYLFGKKYSVPDDLTIMRAMEYAGYQLIR